MTYKLIKSDKFHHMNATVETVQFNDGMTVKRLVSYSSVVCDVCLETGTIFIYPRYQYSSTTVRQVTRFLNEYMPLADGWWNIGLIRELNKRADSNGHVVIDDYNVSFRYHVLGTDKRW